MIDTQAIQVTIDRGEHTVLVVDDNEAKRYAAARVLRGAGFRTLEAASGHEALQRARESAVSAMVLDVQLPDLDGFEVCRILRAEPATTYLPIIHLSASHVRAEDRVTGLNAGADAYMIHPIEPAVLVATVQALIRARTAEVRLRRSEQRFRAIHDQAQSGIGLLDADARFEDANPALLRLLDRPREAVLGQTIASLAPEEWAPVITRRLAESGTDTWRGEFPLLRADGHPVYLDWTVSPPMEQGLRIAICNDASERHELEQRRRDLLEREQAARAMAERHSRTKDDFIAVLSHELRTPLNSIVGWVAILTRRNPTPETLKGLQSIERNAKTQARIISDILDVSRINSGKLRLEMEHARPAQVVANGIDALRAAIDERAIRVEQDLDDGGLEAWLDPSRYQQIVWNLLTNAIKFSDRGGVVEVRLRRHGDLLSLVVRDHGQGIKPEFLPHLFERFTQSDSPGNRAHGGLGLGLSIVQHLVELHGGEVRAESEGPGHGTAIFIDIPVAASREDLHDSDFTRSQPGTEEDAGEDPLRGLDILVVEDDAGASEMLSVVLTDRGARVRAAADFETAVAELARAWPDVLVSDIGLPGRDGYELVRQARAMLPPMGDKPARMAAVALTAFARPEDARRAIQAGFDAHVAKPLKPHVLVAAILDARSRQGR